LQKFVITNDLVEYPYNKNIDCPEIQFSYRFWELLGDDMWNIFTMCYDGGIEECTEAFIPVTIIDTEEYLGANLVEISPCLSNKLYDRCSTILSSANVEDFLVCELNYLMSLLKKNKEKEVKIWVANDRY
jgi:hypothetical protein